MNNHENCINKEKLLEYINERLKNAEEQYNDEFYLQAKIFEIEDWIEKIEKGEFDNE
ncbi:hypothetical protein [Spiroplasma endosymbiont of Villa modesta]|uniref:hypothetical protein n=1 Tax=Spiroplasma endosymbiont of Villa modesta TaxID=3066293 RepID=UPI00313DB8B7